MAKAHSPLLRTFGKRWLKPLTLAVLLAPLVYLCADWISAVNGGPHDLGFNPIQTTHHFLGETAIRVLLATLAVSPLRDITGWAPLALVRRRIGLAAFFYALLHLLVYVGLDLQWSMPDLIKDVVKRTYITFGMAALVLMLPLALTSTNGMIRRLGHKTWDRVHWLIFPLAILALIHHFFAEKGLQPGPVIHAAILILLLGWRLARWGLARLRPEPVAAS
ncbi:MAG: protein-methionine-sulfoxide reductase heme-binding subunit MsrQ [Alphaproteobacteria bacterium]|nr:protein-methionine-sulfoxide reductase heme-binding subunit MsrQ [Alphaproteobacteria bacterium]